MKKEPRMIIENCEERLSDWLLAEYRHCSEIWPGLLFTGIRRKKDRKLLEDIGEVSELDSFEYTGGSGCIILDHMAQDELTEKEMRRYPYLIVGGILGYDRPLGRTAKLITSKFDASRNITRNMGRIQMTIDSAVFVARAILLGASVAEIEVSREVEIKWDDVHTTHLPYGYPIVDDKLILTPGIIDVLRKGWNSRR
jgi:ribosome biogenesis SPOUT family RNA methylase Rps3